MSTDGIAELIQSGPFILAFLLAVAAGLVSFLSPCVLPLLPGYLSYVTGLGAADLAEARRGRMVLGSSLFVLGFSAVFISLGSIVGGIGFRLSEHQRPISIVMGIVLVILGFAFMGMVPFLQRDVRIHQVPAIGVAFAPLLGALFAIGWAPCVGPTLAGVLALSTATGSGVERGALLTAAYCLGLGIPFVLAALGFSKFMRTVGWFRTHQRAISIVSGSTMILVGVLLFTGVWDDLISRLMTSYSGVNPAI
ncbi:cytochrome c biogenesis protein CcdA [soil metagenome]